MLYLLFQQWFNFQLQLTPSVAIYQQTKNNGSFITSFVNGEGEVNVLTTYNVLKPKLVLFCFLNESTITLYRLKLKRFHFRTLWVGLELFFILFCLSKPPPPPSAASRRIEF